MPVVLIFKNENQSVEFPLLGKSTVGRSSSCDLKIEDRQMSGKHGSFEIAPNGQLMYTDLGSTNGSFLNNSQITKTIFKLNDRLKLGNTWVSIDEKSLTSKERLAIGKTFLNEDETLVVGTLSQSNQIIPADIAVKKAAAQKAAERKSVVLNKDLKKKKLQQANWTGRSDENVIEAEESSGKTKFLKLDVGKKKK